MLSGKTIEAIALRFAQTRSGLGEPGAYEYESLYIKEQTQHPDHSQTVHFRYVFDEDGFSQYDKTITFTGYVTIDREGNVLASDLAVVEIGVAACYQPPPGLPWG